MEIKHQRELASELGVAFVSTEHLVMAAIEWLHAKGDFALFFGVDVDGERYYSATSGSDGRKSASDDDSLIGALAGLVYCWQAADGMPSNEKLKALAANNPPPQEFFDATQEERPW